MQFFVYRIDKPALSAVRQRTRPAHLAWAATLGNRVVYAGPTLSDDGTAMTGSVWVLEAASHAEADAIMQGDPYEQAGLFQSRQIHRFMQVIPSPQPSMLPTSARSD